MKTIKMILSFVKVFVVFVILGIAYEYFKAFLPPFILVYDKYIRLFLLFCFILCIAAAIWDLVSLSRFYSSGLPQIDRMDGHDFEVYSAHLLRQNGFRNVRVTQASGDFGVDIIAQRNGASYAIQCKRYSKHVGVKAVQEATSGRLYYRCDRAVVLTNNYFTAPAKELASRTDVILWNRDSLHTLIKNAKKNAKTSTTTRTARAPQNSQPIRSTESVPSLQPPCRTQPEPEEISLQDEAFIQDILLETQKELSADISVTDEYVENILRDSIQNFQS